MHIGITGEPMLRQWYSDYIGVKIEEVGIAVWKKDPRFRASLDGKYGNKGVEFKITENIYKPLMYYYHTRSKNYNNLPPVTQYTHIWESHYNQMIQCMKICGLDSIDYVVSGYKENKVYIEKILPNENAWNSLHTDCCLFLDNYVEPLMIQHNIKRIDPYMMEDIN